MCTHQVTVYIKCALLYINSPVKHTHTHTHTRTYAWIHIPACTHARTHARTHAHTHTHTHTRMHTRTHAQTYTCCVFLYDAMMLPNSLQFFSDTSTPSTSKITSPGYMPARNAAEPCVTVYTTVSAISPLVEIRP